MAQLNPRSALIETYLDGGATQSQLAELGALLANDPLTADEFVTLVRLDALLESHFVEGREEAGWRAEYAAAPSSAFSARRIATAVVTVVALVLMVGLFVWWRSSIKGGVGGHRVVSGRVDVNGIAATDIPVDAPFRVLGSSAATIRLADGCDARLSPATAGVLRRYGNEAVVELAGGGGEFHLNRACPLRVDTFAGSIVAKNASFQVDTQCNVQSEDPAMSPGFMTLLTVAVLTGQVEVHGGDENVKVAAGEKRVFSSEKVPRFVGRVVAVSPDGKQLVLEGKSPKPGAPAPRRELDISEKTQLHYYGVYGGGDRPTVGYTADAVLDKLSPQRAIRVSFGNPQPDVSGVVVDLGDQGQSITVEIFRKKEAPQRRTIQVIDRTRILFLDADETRRQAALGDRLEGWLESDSNSAIELRIRNIQKGKMASSKSLKGTKEKSAMKPNSGKQNKEPKSKQPPASNRKTEKPAIESPKSKQPVPAKSSKRPNQLKPAADQPSKALPPASPRTPGRVSIRDPLPIATEIDRLVEQRLAAAGIATSPLASDPEFLRRATLNIAGRVPTYDETLAFLESEDPQKRQALIDSLLDRASYGEHFAAIWEELIVPRDTGKPKTGRNPFREWLAEQFQRNRGWNEIVRDMLTVEGKIREQPQSGFILANSENQEPRANLLADATARLFWGVQLRCAECHNHPFADWEQTDFWGTAAFFGRLRRGYTEGKNPSGWTLTELPADETERRYGALAPAALDVVGPAIAIPESGGKGAGSIVKARFLGGDEVDWTDDGPYRPRFAAWAVGRENPYFAANTVNRLWAHFFGRGLVNPLDQFHEGNPPSHPELLQRLSAELVASDYDLKHLVRCICNSRTYQRSSRPADGNSSDETLLSHMAVRVMRPEVLYDSLSIVLYPPQAKPGPQGPQPIERAGPIPGVSRDEFVRFFASVVDENTGSTVNQGIPQYLRLMNGMLVDGEAPGVKRLSQFSDGTDKLVEAAFLTAYSRRPTDEESKLAAAYIDASPDRNAGCDGLLWTLLNSSEFVLNH